MYHEQNVLIGLEKKIVDTIQSVKGQSIFWTKIIWIKYRMDKK